MNRTHFFIPSFKTTTELVGKGRGNSSFKRKNYTSHGKRIYREVTELRSSLKRKKDFDYSSNVYSKIQAPENISLKSIKGALEHLGISITSIDPQDKSKGVVSIKKNELDTLNEKIHNYSSDSKNPLKSYIKYIEGLSPVTFKDKFRSHETENKDGISINTIIHLHEEVNEEKMDVIIGFIKSEHNIETHDIQKLLLDDHHCVISVSTQYEKLIDIGETFNLIQSIEPNPESIITQSIPSFEIDHQLQVEYDSNPPTVILVDSGVSASGLMKNCILSSAQSLPEGISVPEYGHGTFVASRICFGDELDRMAASGRIKSYCNIIDVAVFGALTKANGKSIPIGPNRTQLSEILYAAAKKYSGKARVVNLSLGESQPIENLYYSFSAYWIDRLSREFDLLFIIASGNIKKPLGGFPDEHFFSSNARICPPAESALGLTIGSFAKYSDNLSLSRQNQLSPFSRRGPGVNDGLKPELVHHGGNLTHNYLPFPRTSASGLFQSGRHLATDNGTSFSAPIVSQIAARLFHFYPDRSTNLIKALLIHFTDTVDHHPVLGIKKEHQVGFGVPNYQRAISSEKHSASYLFEGSVKHDEYKVLRFHIPSMLDSDNPDSKLKIKITIACNPPVDFYDPANYIQSKVSVSLDKRDNSSNKKRVSFSPDDKADASWSPIQQLTKSFTRSYSCGEWELRVRGWARGKLANDFVQDFAAVIEIIDEMGSGDPYQGILEETGNTYRGSSKAIDKAA